MIRKKTAIFFILLASIVILAHAIVPHHHHKSQVCVENKHCQNDSLAHNHSTSEHNHEHDGSNETENCILKQIVVIPSNSNRQDFKCLGCDTNHSPFADFHAVLFENEFISFAPKTISIAQIPLISSSHSNFVSNSLGLRAPPVV